MAETVDKRTKTHKVVSEISELIQELKSEFVEFGVPINDDNTTLHRFAAKLEYLLKVDLKERSSFLGTVRHYWDYLCKCLATSKRNVHDGIRFVKGVTEVKTSEGKGRAFIRFCLMHKCFGDTFQQCAINVAVTSDFYGEKSPLRDADQFSFLISCLYELNDVQFDLAPTGHDLDIGWPTFARKVFSTPVATWNLPSRTMSVSSLNSLTSGTTSDMATNNLTSSPSQEMEELRNELANAELARADMIDRIRRLTDGQIEMQEKYDDSRKKTEKVHELLSTENSRLKQDKQELITSISTKEQSWEDEKKLMEYKLKEAKARIAELETQNADSGHRSDNKDHAEANPSSSSEHKVHNSAVRRTKALLDNIKLPSDVRLKNTELDYCEVEEKCRSRWINLDDKMVAIGTLYRGMIDGNQCKSCGAVWRRVSECGTCDWKELIGEFDVLKTEFDALKAEQNQLFTYSANAFAISGYAQNELSILKDENIELKRLLEEAKKDSAPLKHKMEILEATCQTWDKQTASLKDALSAAKEMLEIKNKQMALLKSELEHLRSVKVPPKNGQLVSTPVSTLVPTASVAVGNAAAENVVSTSEMAIKNAQLEKAFAEIQSLSEKLKKLMTLLESQSKELLNLKNQLKNRPSTNSNNVSNSDQVQPTPAVVNVMQQQPPTTTATTTVTTTELTTSPVPKIQSLMDEKRELELKLESSREVTASLLKQIEDKNAELNSVTAQLDHLKAKMARLRAAFSKLKTNEAIMVYELREKRVLMNKLKGQLEMSREQWKEVQRKNNESEIEWQSLRDEFANRRKQDSQEEAVSEPSEDNPSSEEHPEACSSLHPDLLADVSFSPDESSPIREEHEDAKDRRLRFLEEQCRSLCRKLMNNAEHGVELNSRLDSLHEHYGTPSSASTTPDEHDISESSDAECPLPPKTTSITCELDPNVPVSQVFPEPPTLDRDMTDAATPVFNSGSWDIPSVGTSNTHSPPKPSALEMAHSLPKRIEKLKQDKEEMKQELEVVRRAKEVMEAERVSLSAQLQQLTFEKDDVEKHLKEAREALVEATERANNSDAKVQKIKELMTTKLMSIRDQLQERDAVMEKMKSSLQNSQKELEITRKSMEEEVNALRFQLKTEQLQQKTIHEREVEMAELRNKLNEQEAAVAFLEQQLSKVQEERDSDHQTQWSQLEELKTTLANRESCLNDQLKEAVKKLENELEAKRILEEDLKRAKGGNQERVNKLEYELAQLTSDNENLKKRIVKLTKDKDVLWKANDSLSHQKKVLASSRWMDSSTVSKCLRCNVEFGFMLRKHHCRLCGRIFCHACANEWVYITASSEKVRACTDCFTQQDQETDISFMSVDEDDDADEEVTESDVESHNETNFDLSCITMSESSTIMPGQSESRNFWISTGTKCGIPVEVDTPNVYLKWNFTTEPKNVEFYIVFQRDSTKCDVIVGCAANVQPVAGEMRPKKVGTYILVFDNTRTEASVTNVCLSLQVDLRSQET